VRACAGPIELRNPGLLMDVKLQKGGKFQHSFPLQWNCFAYIFDGNGTIGGAPAELQNAVVMEHGDYVEASSSDDKVGTNGLPGSELNTCRTCLACTSRRVGHASCSVQHEYVLI
jgi:Pirin C-terminal cupin domain